MNIYLDLDGTIIDVFKRYYIINSKLYKQKINNNKMLLLENIESLEYLRHDRLICDTKDTLLKLKKIHRLVIVTLRKNKKNLYTELSNLGILDIFDNILTPNLGYREKTYKRDLIKEDSLFDDNNSIIVGDTEVDIKTGKCLGIKTVAVLSGLRTKEMLLAENPDYIIDNINDLPNIINLLDSVKA